MGVIAVTGVAGALGRRLIAHLARDPSIDRIVGIDTRTPVGNPKLEFHQMDVRDGRLADVLEECDTVVHLAFIHDPIKDLDAMRDVNVEGTRHVVSAAVSAGARSLIYPSSGMVYGAHPDNEVPLVEGSALRANQDNVCAAQTMETELLVGTVRASAPEMTVAILRFAVVLGPTVENFVSRMFEAPRMLSVRGYEPPFQCVHEEDAASCIAFAARARLDGTFNVSADGWLSAEEVARIAGKRKVELTESVALSMADRFFRAGLTLAPPSELQFLMHPWVLDNAAIRERGWKPRYTNADTLREAIEVSRSYITLGRARMRKESLAKGAAATLSVVGTLALVRRKRRQG